MVLLSIARLYYDCWEGEKDTPPETGKSSEKCKFHGITSAEVNTDFNVDLLTHNIDPTLPALFFMFYVRYHNVGNED